jgi:hypothetical protein
MLYVLTAPAAIESPARMRNAQRFIATLHASCAAEIRAQRYF